MGQEKDAYACLIIFKEGGIHWLNTCFYKANEVVLADIYQFLRFVLIQICYQQLVL